MNSLLQDLRYAVRSLRASPGFTAVAVLTLALGIGASTAIFSALNQLLLRPLPFQDAERIVYLWQSDTQTGMSTVPPLEVATAWAEHARSFEGIELYSSRRAYVGGAGEPAMLGETRVTPGFLSFLRLTPALGRTFHPEEAHAGAEPVALISHALWRQQFGGSREVIGRALELDGTPHTVIGVMPPLLRRFDWRESTDVWTPLRPAAEERVVVGVVARLRPEVTAEQAAQELNGIAAGVVQSHPRPGTWAAKLVRPSDLFARSLRTALPLLMGAVSLVLLIACANVAHLLIARAARRERELAIRASLGAGRARMVRQLLLESVVLALLGGALGLLLAWWGVALVAQLSPASLSELAAIEIDRRVVGFGLLLSLATGIGFGIVPALLATRLELNSVLQQGSARSTGSLRGLRTRSILMAAEVALSVVLLVSAGLLVRSLAHLHGTDPGFSPEGVATLSVTLPASRYPTPESRLAFLDELQLRVRALPGVTATALARGAPTDYGITFSQLEIQGMEERDGGRPSLLAHNVVEPGFFDALRIPLIEGRSFTDAEQRAQEPAVVINEQLARRYWPDQSPLGERLRFGPGGPWYTVVGVVPSVAATGVIRQVSDLQIYSPFQDFGMPVPGVLLVRSAGDPALLAPALRRLVASLDPGLPAAEVVTAEAMLSAALAEPRFNMVLLTAFAALAVVLAGVGLFGVLSYVVAQRRREIGIRLALGAQTGDALRPVIRVGLFAVLAGGALGVAGALAATRLLRNLVHGVSTTDPISFAGAVLLLVAAALLASYLPARRAARVDPMVALRSE